MHVGRVSDFGLKITPIQTMMCGAKESSNQYQSKHKQWSTITAPRYNLGIKVKSTKPQGKDKGREEKTNTSKIVDPVLSNLT